VARSWWRPWSDEHIPKIRAQCLNTYVWRGVLTLPPRVTMHASTSTTKVTLLHHRRIYVQSDLDSARGSGVPDFKKFSAYNRGPRSKEVDQILTSIYNQSSSHRFWKPNHILKLSVVSAMPQKMLTWWHDGQAVVFNLDMHRIFLNSDSTLNLAITISTHLQYTLKLVSKSAHWQITKSYI
jgi:hypothetical protein